MTQPLNRMRQNETNRHKNRLCKQALKRLKLQVNLSGAALYAFSLIYCIMNLCPLNEFQLKPRVGAKGDAIAPKIYVLYTDGLKQCDETF